jgi:hypothetical protein
MGSKSNAYKAGYEKGQAAASWLLDSNIQETIRKVFKGFEDGDPEIMDTQPSPLSGEWAGESIPELSERYGVDLQDDEKADQFEQGFADGYWDECHRLAKAILGKKA